MEKTQNRKNIVYTFTDYLQDVIYNNDKINNSLVCEIKKDNIKIIQMNTIKSEREFEIHLEDYLKDENMKVYIIKFLPYKGTLMNYIKYLIENNINNHKVFQKKLFIFIVYMTRISLKEINEVEKETKKEKEKYKQKILKNTLSNLSGFYQIFIDNLIGDSKYKIKKILYLKITELFKTLINHDKELTKDINYIFSCIKYNIITPYYEKLIEFILNNKRLRDLINKIIIKQSFKDDTDIITKIFKEKHFFIEQEIDILSVIKNYLSKKI